MSITILTDPEECRQAWERFWPARGLFDLWPVRETFHRAFQRPLHFVLSRHHSRVTGFFPLCWDEETGTYVMFPGETWQGKTWIEQNRVLAASHDELSRMLETIPGPVHLRYLLPAGPDVQGQVHGDEIGFLFYPGLWDFSFDNYWLSFSGKRRKNIRAELKRLEDQGIAYRFDHLPDLDFLFRMNLGAFDRASYFNDPRFQASFEYLIEYLSWSGMLRITTIEVGGKVAAVDLGAYYKNTCTLLAGGTDPEFPGIAKMINLHHMERACRERFDAVDFLCGDFNWKTRFHLTERPLYQLSQVLDPAFAPAFVQAPVLGGIHDRAVA